MKVDSLQHKVDVGGGSGGKASGEGGSATGPHGGTPAQLQTAQTTISKLQTKCAMLEEELSNYKVYMQKLMRKNKAEVAELKRNAAAGATATN